MNQKEKELKYQPVYPGSNYFTGILTGAGLTFYQSLILSLSQNPDITKKDNSALDIAFHINDVAKRIIQVMSQDEKSE